MSYRNYSTAAGFIVDPNGHGDFRTIGAAYTASASGSTIFIRPGTYTENLTVSKNIQLVAYSTNTIDSAASGNPVIIKGTITNNAAVGLIIYGIQLSTNGADCVANTSTGSVTLDNCYLSYTDGSAITQSGGGSNFYLWNCRAGGSGQKFFSVTAGTLFFYYCDIRGDTTASTIGPGALKTNYTFFIPAITSSSTASIISRYSYFENALTIGGSSASTFNFCELVANLSVTAGAISLWDSKFGGTITYSSASTGSSIDRSTSGAITTSGVGTIILTDATVTGGVSSAVTIGAGTTVTVANCTINSSAVNTLTGAGTMNYGGIVFTGSSSGHNVTTEVPLATLN